MLWWAGAEPSLPDEVPVSFHLPDDDASNGIKVLFLLLRVFLVLSSIDLIYLW